MKVSSVKEALAAMEAARERARRERLGIRPDQAAGGKPKATKIDRSKERAR